MEEKLLGEIKGVINYPCCPKKKAMVKIGTYGRASHQCPNCGQYVEFDYDTMTASRIKAFRGVVKKFNNVSK